MTSQCTLGERLTPLTTTLTPLTGEVNNLGASPRCSALLCWETLHAGICLDATMTCCTTKLHVVVDRANPLIATALLNGSSPPRSDWYQGNLEARSPPQSSLSRCHGAVVPGKGEIHMNSRTHSSPNEHCIVTG